MYELPVTKSTYEIVVRHAAKNDVAKVIAVMLEVGALSDLQPMWLQRYFDHLSRGSVAENARLHVDRMPAVFECKSCDGRFEVESLVADALACDQCRSRDVVLQSGRQYMVKGIEVI